MPRKKKQEEIEETEAVEETEAAEEAEEVQEIQPEAVPFVFNMPMIEELPAKKSPKIVTVYGDIDEERCFEALKGLLLYKSVYCEESQELLDPVQMYISTWGGSAADMFSVYDLIRSMRGKVPVHTIGLGKVMSAGVVLLASGEKGHRKIGANCRVMFHGVQAGHAGTIFNLENEMEEAKWTQERYIKALVKETNMSLGYLKKLIDRKLNVYFSAEEAVELGIADEII